MLRSTTLQAKIIQTSSSEIWWWILMQDPNKGWTFSTENIIMDYGPEMKV